MGSRKIYYTTGTLFDDYTHVRPIVTASGEVLSYIYCDVPSTSTIAVSTHSITDQT